MPTRGHQQGPVSTSLIVPKGPLLSPDSGQRAVDADATWSASDVLWVDAWGLHAPAAHTHSPPTPTRTPRPFRKPNCCSNSLAAPLFLVWNNSLVCVYFRSRFPGENSCFLSRILEAQLGAAVPLVRFSSRFLTCPAEPLMRQPRAAPFRAQHGRGQPVGGG